MPVAIVPTSSAGHLHSKDTLFDPAMRALPPVFVVRVPDGPAARWVASQHQLRARRHHRFAARAAVIDEAAELLLTEVLRLHLATAPMAEHGWIAALQDQVLAPAMAQLHAAPQRKWTIRRTGQHRGRFPLGARPTLPRCPRGRSPIRYLTEWRMRLADDLLRTTQLSVSAIARRVGYEWRRRWFAPSGEATAAHPAPGEPHSSAPRDTLLAVGHPVRGPAQQRPSEPGAGAGTADHRTSAR